MQLAFQPEQPYAVAFRQHFKSILAGDVGAQVDKDGACSFRERCMCFIWDIDNLFQLQNYRHSLTYISLFSRCSNNATLPLYVAHIYRPWSPWPSSFSSLPHVPDLQFVSSLLSWCRKWRWMPSETDRLAWQATHCPFSLIPALGTFIQRDATVAVLYARLRKYGFITSYGSASSLFKI